jgi:hypothetical protein
LSEFGLEHFNAPFLLHILQEQSENSRLSTAQIRNSMDRWWSACIRNVEERLCVQSLIQAVRHNEMTFRRKTYRRIIIGRQQFGRLMSDARPTQPLALIEGEWDEDEPAA